MDAFCLVMKEGLTFSYMPSPLPQASKFLVEVIVDIDVAAGLDRILEFSSSPSPADF